MTDANRQAQQELLNLYAKEIHQNNIHWPAVIFVDDALAKQWRGRAPWVELTAPGELELAHAAWVGREDVHGHSPSETRTHAFVVSLA